MKVVKFGTHWVDGVLIASAIFGLFEAMWLMADIMPFGAKMAMLIAVVSLISLAARDILSRMALFELRTAVDDAETVAGNPDKAKDEEAVEADKWAITSEEDEALEEFIDAYLDESVNEFWYKEMYAKPSYKRPKPMQGLKCEYAEGWWKDGRNSVSKVQEGRLSTVRNRVHAKRV